MLLTLAQLPLWATLLCTLAFAFVSIVLILTILIQKPQGGGLAGAFGSGAGSGQTAFGAKTGDALTWATIIMFTVFVLGSIGLNFAMRLPEAPPTGDNPAGATPPAPDASNPDATNPATGQPPATGEPSSTGQPPATGEPPANTPEQAPGVTPPGNTPPEAPEATPPSNTPPPANAGSPTPPPAR